jgi:hypothetical protein
MNQQERVIVWDGTGQERVGSLVHLTQALHAEETSGRVVTLPTDARAFGTSALGGYSLRQWGTGVRFSDMRPQRGCPIAVHVAQDVPYVHWAVRIEKADKSAGMRGTFALVGSSDPVIPMVGALSALGRPADLTQLGEPDERGGWVLRGKLGLRTMVDGLCPLIAQAVADNLLVRWVAVSQSRAVE